MLSSVYLCAFSVALCETKKGSNALSVTPSFRYSVIPLRLAGTLALHLAFPTLRHSLLTSPSLMKGWMPKADGVVEKRK